MKISTYVGERDNESIYRKSSGIVGRVSDPYHRARESFRPCNAFLCLSENALRCPSLGT